MRASIDKQRDIARSILPSTHRRQARRDLTAVRRSHRRGVRQDLHRLTADAYLDSGVDLTRTCDREIIDLVWWRRQADKLNHFEHWAVRVTAHLPIEDRRSHLRAILPDGLIGEHAMSHLDWIPEINPHGRRWWWIGRSEAWAEEQRARERAVVAGLRALLEVPEGHATLNRALRAAEVGDGGHRSPVPCGRRLLGHHDVEAFVAHQGDRGVVTAVLDDLVPGWRDRA